MMNPGLDAAGVRRMKETACGVHNVYVMVQVLDWNHRYLGDASNMLLEGQINFSAAAEVSRTGTLTLWDPDYDLELDSPNPTLGGLFYFRQIKITYCIWRFGDLKSIDIPLFCGPITDLKRVGGEIELTLAGKEWIFGNVWKPLPFAKGASKRNALASLLRDRGGEMRLEFDKHGAKFGGKVNYPREADVWKEGKALARSMSMQLFYNGRGVARLREQPSSTLFVFRDGSGGSLTSVPTFGYSDDQRQNVAWLVGGKPKGSKRTTTYTSTLSTTDAMNHNNLGRIINSSGTKVPTIYLEKIQDSKVTRKTDAKKRADASLRGFKNQQMAISFNAMIMAFLEEGDLTELQMQGEYSIGVRMNTFSVPLLGPASSYGSNRNLALKKRR